MDWEEDSHQWAGAIMKAGFRHQRDELVGAIEAIDISACLNPTGPLSLTSRPATPKSHFQTIGGRNARIAKPISQKALNKQFRDLLKPRGWQKEPVVDEADVMGTRKRLWGDFVKDKVFVEVEFGNDASFYRDILKFQLAHRSQRGDIGVLITATLETALLFDDGVVHYQGVKALKPYLRFGTQMPVWIVGIYPADFAPVRRRYEEMQQVLEGAGEPVHPWETVMRASSDPATGVDAFLNDSEDDL